jgi:hypothetical protein
MTLAILKAPDPLQIHTSGQISQMKTAGITIDRA